MWAVALVACVRSASNVGAPQLVSEAALRRTGDRPAATCDPGPDSDHDGVPDWRDECPYDLETYNGYQDEDGCLDRSYTTVREARPKITGQLCFSVGSVELSPEADRTLDSIAGRLRALDGKIQLLEIGGHADDQEPDGWNLALRRAESVLCRLTRYGVARQRLFARRYGTQPRGTESASSSCESNRRVDFSVIEYGYTL